MYINDLINELIKKYDGLMHEEANREPSNDEAYFVTTSLTRKHYMDFITDLTNLKHKISYFDDDLK